MLTLVAAPMLAAADAANNGGLPEWVTIMVSVIVALGGGGSFFKLLQLRSDRNAVAAGTEKSRAEAADIVSGTAVELLTPLREELLRTQEALVKTREEARHQIVRVETRVAELEQRLVIERETADTRIKQLQLDIAERDRHIRSQGAEILQLRRSAPGWPGGAAES